MYSKRCLRATTPSLPPFLPPGLIWWGGCLPRPRCPQTRPANPRGGPHNEHNNRRNDAASLNRILVPLSALEPTSRSPIQDRSLFTRVQFVYINLPPRPPLLIKIYVKSDVDAIVYRRGGIGGCNLVSREGDADDSSRSCIAPQGDEHRPEPPRDSGGRKEKKREERA